MSVSVLVRLRALRQWYACKSLGYSIRMPPGEAFCELGLGFLQAAKNKAKTKTSSSLGKPEDLVKGSSSIISLTAM